MQMGGGFEDDPSSPQSVPPMPLSGMPPNFSPYAYRFAVSLSPHFVCRSSLGHADMGRVARHDTSANIWTNAIWKRHVLTWTWVLSLTWWTYAISSAYAWCAASAQWNANVLSKWHAS